MLFRNVSNTDSTRVECISVISFWRRRRVHESDIVMSSVHGPYAHPRRETRVNVMTSRCGAWKRNGNETIDGVYVVTLRPWPSKFYALRVIAMKRKFLARRSRRIKKRFNCGKKEKKISETNRINRCRGMTRKTFFNKTALRTEQNDSILTKTQLWLIVGVIALFSWRSDVIKQLLLIMHRLTCVPYCRLRQ